MEIVKKDLQGIEFRFFGPDSVRKLSVMEVSVPELYDQDGFPVEGGLMDPRLGVVDPGMRCRSCGGKVGHCPGHFGHIEFAKPVIHVRFGKKIYMWLSMACPSCGRVAVEKEARDIYEREFQRIDNEGTNSERAKLIRDIAKEAKKHSVCPHCGADKPAITYEKPTTYYQGEDKLTPVEVRENLEKIPDEDLFLLGVDSRAFRPEWAVMTSFLVPPVTVRPCITLETGERSEDDLTHKLVDIMRINLRLRENMASGAPAVIIEDLWELLQYHATTFIDNQVSGIPPARHRAGRILKGVVQRVKTKQGRFRRNLAGKRVNFSARTVVSPDARIGVDEVGIPDEIARDLTVSVYVTDENVEQMKEVIRRGPEALDGANYVIDDQGNRLRITDFNQETLAEQVAPGWMVDRHLKDGDVVLMNRQPSLHRMSLMGHRVRVLPGRTFRIHPSICAPYNADFDGDEMNLHDPQGEEARAEALELLGVRKNLRSPRFGGVIIGGWRTQISGLFLLTQKDTVLSREKAFQLIYDAGIEAELPSSKKEITGREIFSLLLPSDFNIRFKTKASKSGKVGEDDSEVVVKDGKLLKGVIDSSAVGSFGGRILDRIVQEYGPDFGTDFINKLAALGLLYLKMRGMTVSIEDFEIPEETHKEINQTLSKAKREVRNIIKKAEAGKLKSWPGMSMVETRESEIIHTLNKARDEAVRMVGDVLSPSNPAAIMAISGARGNLLNVALIAGAVGQQAIGGGRPKRGYYSSRTFPHFVKHDLGAESKGFVRSSYGSGLNPFEFFWVSASGREGLTDTGVKTPKSGYMYRRLSNALQDLKVEYDGTVRDSGGNIIQFLYGEDGIDVSMSDKGFINLDRLAELARGGDK
ncbi:MAG TPA: DNA-directed RNA polymerase subunit A' [archaeon]|nr:DNA-directed RNA polymerase subunit A' [archaeon]